MSKEDLKIFTATKAKSPEYEHWWKETFGIVETVPTIEHLGIGDDAPLRRFMDLPKFLHLIISGRLFLPRLAELKQCDPHECDAKPDYSQVPREELERRVIDLREFAPKSAIADSGFGSGSRYLPALDVADSFDDRVKRMSLDELKQAAWFGEHSRLKQEWYVVAGTVARWNLMRCGGSTANTLVLQSRPPSLA
jgi:hypothetical protein